MIRRLVTYNFACIVFLGDITYNGGEECPSSAARLSTLLEDTSFFPFLFSQASLTCITSRLPSIMPNHRSPQQSKTKTHNTPVAPSLYIGIKPTALRSPRETMDVNCTSQLLIWPRRRRRPREDVGFVLGWIHHQGHRETVICAGILPPNLPLSDYKQRIQSCKNFKIKGKSNGDVPLAENLQIVAIWRASPTTSLDNWKDESVRRRVLTQQRKGYPWWVDDEKADEEILQHKQVIFYDPPSRSNFAAHLQSEFNGYGDDTIWPDVLEKLNHANDLMNLLVNNDPIQTGTDDAPRSPSTEVDKDKVPSDSPDMQGSSWVRMVLDLPRHHSMTYLHITKRRRGLDGFLSWFSFISFLRCLTLWPSRRADKDPSVAVGSRHLFHSRSQRAHSFVHNWNEYISSTLDFSLGVGVAFLLFMAWRFSNPDRNLWSYYTHARIATFEYHYEFISWLENFPAGFKLNVTLTKKMGNAIRSLMQGQRSLMESSFWNAEMGQNFVLPLLIVVSGGCGFSSLLALLMDLWRLETGYAWLLANIFRYIYRVELFLLSALFRLFRGKKRNVLRQRTDSMQYDSMQLLVGTLCLCVCVFLWTTLMVYYSSCMLASLLLNLPVIVLWATYAACESLPLATVVWRLYRPEWFSANVYLDRLSGDSDTVQVARLCSVPEPLGKLLLSRLVKHLAHVATYLATNLAEVILPNNKQFSCCIPLHAWMCELYQDQTTWR